MPGALRGNVHWYDYGPVIGAELSDNRPALVISNDVTSRQLELCITAPMSTAIPDVRFRMHHTRIEEADSWRPPDKSSLFTKDCWEISSPGHHRMK